MKTFIALAGVVVGGVTIIAATILTVWNFTAGLLMLAAAFTVLVFTAWLIRRREDRDEVAKLKAAHANTIRELADTRDERDEIDRALVGAARERNEAWREIKRLKIAVEDLQAKEKRWLGHYDVCERAQAVADHDRDQAASNA